MTEDYVSFNEIEDGVATLVLYKDEGSRELFYYPLDELPSGVDRDQLGCKFWPEFDDNGEIASLYYDEELTQRESKKAQEAVEKYKEMLDDSE